MAQHTVAVLHCIVSISSHSTHVRPQEQGWVWYWNGASSPTISTSGLLYLLCLLQVLQIDIFTLNVSRCQTPSFNAAHCNTLQHTAAHCSTLQHAVTHCAVRLRASRCVSRCQTSFTAAHCNTLQHTATHRNTLQHTLQHNIPHPATQEDT